MVCLSTLGLLLSKCGRGDDDLLLALADVDVDDDTGGAGAGSNQGHESGILRSFDADNVVNDCELFFNFKSSAGCHLSDLDNSFSSTLFSSVLLSRESRLLLSLSEISVLSRSDPVSSSSLRDGSGILGN